MSQLMLNLFVLALGLVALGYVVQSKKRGLWPVCWGGVGAGLTAWVFLLTRRQFAFNSRVALKSWWDEILIGGNALTASPYAGTERVSGVALWLVVWALLLYQDDEEERGPWILAFLPLAIVVAMFAFGPQFARDGQGTGDARRMLLVVGLVFVGYLALLALYRRARRTK